MKYLLQLLIILSVSFAGEVLDALLPLPVPASVYGIAIMLLCLGLGVIRLEWVKETAMFLVGIMPVMFIPAAVGIFESWGMIKHRIALYAATVLLSTAVVMAVSGRVTQRLLRLGRREK